MIEAPTLETLDPSLVQNTADSVIRQVVEFDPRVDIARGAIYDVITWIHSLLHSQNETLLILYLASRSLTTIKSDPALADPEMVTDIVANFGIDRLPTQPARGEIKIVRDTDTPYVVPVGSVFFSGSLRFVTETVFSARNDPGDVVTSTDRLITQVDNDSYSFTISVVCQTEGSVGMLRQNALLTPEVIPSGFVSAYAASDFQDGRDLETNEDLITKLEAGVARPSFASRPAMRAMLRDNENLNDFVSDSIVGAGHAEMRRDKRFLIPIGVGGRVDWYVRTDEVAVKTRITKSAILIEKREMADNSFQSVWRVVISKDDLPGFYEVVSIIPDGSTLGGSFQILSETRGVTIDEPIPDISVASDGRYSRYQNATVEFLDTATDVTDLTVGAAADYAITLSAISRIADVQDDYASNPAVNHPGADCLVRAPFPCWIKVDIILSRQEVDPPFDVGAIQSAVASAVNRTGFTGRLFLGDLVAAAYGVIGSNGKVSFASARGRLLGTDGITRHFDSTTVITIPDLPLVGLSHRTVQFFTSVEDISVSDSIDIPTAR